MKKLILMACALACTPFLNAQQINTDRPDQTESSLVVPKNSFQIEAGIVTQHTYGLQQDLLPSVLWRYGIHKDFELRLVTQFESYDIKALMTKQSGLGDLQIGTKIQLYRKEDAKTSIAFLSHVVLPTAKDAISNQKVGTINKLSIAHELSANTSIGYNIGYDYFGADRGNITYSVAYGISLSDKLGMYVEPFGSLENLNTHVANFDTGFTYLVNDHFQLDISYGTGLNYRMNYFSTGFSWVLHSKKKK